MKRSTRPRRRRGRFSAGWADPRVDIIVEVFRRSLSRRIKINELSAAVRLSPSGLRRLFRQQMGCSIGKWQRVERLRVASSLLCTTCLSVKEINAAVGYGDLSHFVQTSKSVLASHQLDIVARILISMLWFAPNCQQIVNFANSANVPRDRTSAQICRPLRSTCLGYSEHYSKQP